MGQAQKVTPCEVGGSRECGGGRAQLNRRSRRAGPPGLRCAQTTPLLAPTPAPNGLGALLDPVASILDGEEWRKAIRVVPALSRAV
jgi:hypothetical protein